ncbi:MAG: DnaJ domain-containing protein [Spirochaetales bacterium]|mgnify:CR=1|jgi:DnaJ-domain-containing protein 1|nr:DnaJ domain-containing protein [Spirochaetales bacterium]
MDQIFDRLGNLLKSFIPDDDRDSSSRERNSSFSDPDLQDAWAELDEYMKTGDSQSAGNSSTGPNFREAPAQTIPSALKKDYQTLKVPVGTPIEDVTKSYKTLLRKHHPDRHATDPAALAQATEITKQLTSSFRRIRQFSEAGTL